MNEIDKNSALAILDKYRARPAASDEDKSSWTGNAKAFGLGLLNLPGKAIDTLGAAWDYTDVKGSDLEAVKAERDEQMRAVAARKAEANDTLVDIMESLPYSVATMGAGAAGSVFGPAGALGASGSVAHRASVNEKVKELLIESEIALGRPPTDEEFERIKARFNDYLMEQGLAEAVPEAASNLALGGIVGKAGKAIINKAGITNRLAVGGLQLGLGAAEEVPSEVLTGMLQGASDAKAGFRETAPTVGEVFSETAPTAAGQAVMLGLGLKGAGALARRFGKSKTGEGDAGTTPSNSPDNPFAQGGELGTDGYQYENPLNLEQAEASLEPKNSPEVDLLGVLNKRLEAKNDAADRTMAAVYGKLTPKLDADGKVLEKGGGIDSLEDGSLVVYGARDKQGEGVDEAPLVLTSEEDKRIALDVARQLREEQSAREIAQTRREAPAWIAKQGKPVSAEAFSARNNGYQVPAGELAPVDIAGMAVPPSAPMMSGGNLGLQLGEHAERMAAWDSAQPAPQIASMAMPQTMAQPAAVQPATTIPQSGFGLAGVQPVQPQKVEPSLEVLPEVEPVSAENVTKQPEMMAENVTPAKPLSTESSTNVGLENKSKSKGELRGMPLDQRIVIGAPAPVGASRDDIREAEQRFNDFRKKEEDIQKRHAEAFEELKKRASKVETKEEADALLDEYTKVEGYHLEGYDQLSKMTASSVSRAEERRRLENRKRRYDAGEWVVAAETNSVEQAERERDRLTKNDPANEYRVESDMDGWRGVVMKRKRSAEASDDSESSEKKDYGTADSLDVNAIADHFLEQFMAGKAYRSIGEARQEVASLMGLKQKELVRQVKTIDEAIELGVVKAARKIVRSGKPQLEVYRDLVDLYKRQPNLGVRTSTSVAEQAYSTPVPLAYLADVLAGVNESTRVYEPTAGNGALLLTASPENAVVNELNHDRAERLRSLGFDVTEEDASTLQLDEDVDAVVANPPFGTVLMEGGKDKRKFRFRNLETSEIDQAISLNALDELKKDGRAVLIIGGKHGGEEARSKKYNTAGQRAFWDTLFRNFNVVDHFTVDGKLYSRQGASYPIDFIVIDGHTPTENPVFPAAKVPQVFDSFESLEVKFNEVLRNESERTERDSVAGREDDSQPVRTDGRDSGMGREVPDGRNAGSQTGDDAGLDKRPVEQERRAGSVGDEGKPGKRDRRNVRDSGRSGGDGVAAEPSQPDDQRGRLAGDDRNGRGGSGVRAGEELPRTDRGAGTVRPGLDVDQPALPETQKAKKAAPKPKETDSQASYKTSSDGFQLGTLVPRNMDAPVQDALLRTKNRHGSVDEFVADELGYDSVEEMHKAFAAEQVDALALALDNIKRGKGFILGDQTGIGKGRVCAGIIRWAKKNGKTPVFVTMLPDLYADMMRDLNDIGVHDFHPFITNDSIRGTKSLVAPDGSKLSAPTDTNYKKALAYVKEHKTLPEEYDAVFTSYSQMQSKKNSSNPRQQMLIALRDNVVLVLDEAHNAGGSESSIGMFFRSYTEGLDNGVLYSSATYAKRPDVMSLYNTTDLSLLGNKDEIEDIMHSGGLPMQQVVSAMLTSSGQYVRREKSYEGADMTTTEAPVSAKLADSIADCMDAVMKFSVEMGPVVEHMDKVLKAQGKTATGNQGTGGAGASSTTFGAVMHNLVAQSTLAIKADATIKAAKAAVERGEKPIITLSNTMGSFIEEYVKLHGLKAGDRVDLSFADLFKNYLEKTREVTVTPPNARPEDKQRIRVADKDLTPGARAAYRNALRLIESVDFSGIPVSPIDYILDGLRREGISASEITGRTATLDYSGAAPVYRVREASVAEKQKASSGFNGGSIDVLIINRSGSTGISLHASEKFADQKRRTMFILQPDLNIDVFMQTLGRVFRTGQVVPPKYEFILSDMPSERRPAAVLGKKMASLNANTTASAKGTQSFDNIPDFLNVYGDQAAFEILTEDRALDQRLGNILGDGEKYDNLVAKLTGRIPLLRMTEQADVYDRLQGVYQGIVDMATATGTNVLDVKSKPLDAKVVRRAEFTPQEATGSPFGEASELCECDVKVLGKPFTSAEVKQHIADGKAAAIPVEELAARKRAYEKERLKKMENEEVRARESEKLDEQFVRVSEAMTGYPVGTRVRLNSTTGSYVGFVVNYVFDAKKKGSNPVAPSSWRVVVDIADAKRRIAIPMSKLVLGDGNIDEGRVLMNYTYDRVSEADFLKRFDEGQSESREKRFIVMGNIPAGFKFAEKGEIITFDMHDGRRVMGLMLPKDVSGDQLLSDKPVVFSTAAQAEEFLSQSSDIRQVKSSDEKLSIDNTGRFGTFSVRVPASKKDGGTYFLDKKLTDAMGAIFTKSGQDMKAMVDKEDLPAMLNYLYQRGVKLQATANKVEARKITGETGKLEGVSPAKGRSSRMSESEQILAESLGLASLRPSFASVEGNGQSRKNVQDVVDKLNSSVAGAAPVNVVQSFDELPEKLKQNFKDRDGELEGVYDEGTVWLVADNLASPERVTEVWMHEQVGHGGFEALMPEKEKTQLLNRLFGMMGGKGNAALRAIAEEYGLDLDKRADQHRALREYLADLAEKEGLSGQEMTRWQRAWKLIADTLKKLVYRLTGQHTKIAEMEVRDLLTAMKARVRDGGPDGPKGGTYASFISNAAKSAADKVAKAMKKPEGFSDDFMESYKNLSAQAKRDLSVWNRFVSQPYALAKKFPLIRSLMNIQSEREDKRREAYTSSMAGVDTFQKMKESDPTAYKYARDLIIALDSETGDKLKTQLDEDMFLFDEDGKRTGFNPKYYAQLRDLVMRARNRKTHSDEAAFGRAVDAYMGVRRSLDRDLASILSRMEELGFKSREAYLAEFEKRKAELEADETLTKKQRQDALDAISMANKREQEKLDTLRKSMGRRPFYFPRMRFGDYFARFVDADGKTLYRVHYDASTQTQAAYEAAKIKATMEAELKKMGVDLADVKFENGKIEGIPQEMFADALSTVDTQAILERALGRLQEKGEVTGEELSNLRDSLFDQVSEVLKSSGFGQHMMRRGNSNIAGYETEDVFKSLSAYKAGLHGWLTKMEASYAFASTLSEAAEDGAARKSPKMYGYAKQYVRDMLRNADAVDRTNSRIRAGLFLWFLGGNIKSALVNATQNFSLGVPVLGTEIGFGKAYGKILSGSRDAVVDWASKREAGQESKKLTKAEASFLDDFQKHGEALARKTMELTGMQDRSWTSTWYGKLAEWAGKPIEYAEKFNRLSLALAAYRAAKAGDVKNESTLAEYGEEKGKPWSEANARKFAREVVNEAHFVYGKANQPAPVRGFARGLGFGYTFRTYAQSLASWYYHMLAGEKGNVGRIAAAQAALHATALGGVAAIPLYGTMRTVLTQIFGGEPPEEVLGYDQIDILMYGLPSLGGVYLGGSMELDLPAIAGAKQGNESWIEQLHDNVFLAVTGPLGGALDRLGRATYFADTGQTGRVLEELAPTAVTNVLKAHRLATTGARTKSGKPIPALGDKSGKPAQLSGAEVALQGLGFQPMSRAKGWQAYQTKQEKTAYKSDFQSDLVTRYVMAKASKDWKEVDKLVAEWRDWNKEHPDQKIKPLAQLAKRRERPVK
ncbi:MAG: PLxRFG domain-containing protein [Mailhella sp.]|nr:PLxRFG domain-containing protein [Mailhella sp.]